MDYTAHGILQARILEWVAFSFSRGSSQPRDWIQASCIAGGFFTSWATREANQNHSKILLDTYWHLLGWRLYIYIKQKNNRCWWGWREILIFGHCWWECRIGWLLWKTLWQFLRKQDTELSFDPVISTPQRSWKQEFKETLAHECSPALFTTSKRWKQPKCPPTGEWINRMWRIHTMKYYSAIKKEWSWVVS